MSLSAELLSQLDALDNWGLIATDTDLVVTGWNRWLELRTGRVAANALGHKLFDLFPDLETRGLDRYFRQALAGQTAILSHRFHKYIFPLPPTAVGQERMQQTGRIVPLLDGEIVCGTLSVIEDVTERVIREAELQSRTLQQTALAFSARSALAGHDIVDLCRESVHHLSSALGADFVEALELQPGGAWARLAGAGWSDQSAVLFDPVSAPRILAVLRSSGATMIGDPNDSASATDATLQAHSVTSGLVVRIPSRGVQPFGLLGAYTLSHRQFTSDQIQFAQALADIIGTAAERKRLETELRLRAGELSVADRRKDEFLAMLAHELRNPLAPIRNGLQILRLSGAGGEAVRSATEMMDRQMGQMVRLVDDLLDVSRVSRGKIELKRGRVELASVVYQAVEAVRSLYEGRGHHMTVTLPAQPIYLNADPTRLAQAVGNLLNNACKFTNDGGHISLTAEREGGEAVVRVRDNGIGIAADHLPHIFDMFMQVDTSLERSVSGLGIGLTVVKSLVEMHGGTVAVYSAGSGLGSEFVVRLPVVAEPPKPPPELSVVNPAVMTARRILVVDDNQDSAESLSQLLELTGNETRAAFDGLEAVEAAGAFRPDVILMDIGLPKLNGYEAARKVREQPWGEKMVLVALTGWGQEEDRQKARDAGFDGHMVKPVDYAALTKLLAELVHAKT